uniref:VOC domain-containing protein n=1 Tax=Cyanothece sp. (strain PCC 7425 / ATCC 29141) TaxID=395961 RepID=B8HQB6_CYAP4
MHRSQLAGLIIDCQTDNLEQAAEFWSQALGYAIKPSTAPEDQNYAVFAVEPDQPYVEVQKVDHPSRVHLDIETDDIEAEVSRLEKLGAKRLRQVQNWWVMEAPTGHRFCVVPAYRSNFSQQANLWDS